ncbi:MAG: T9SS type A sorting domain-containing protein [Fibrobacteres bacterium]|nr:T9SS type A sorting domain-containing protein [Fibrobacterota bacterium]
MIIRYMLIGMLFLISFVLSANLTFTQQPAMTRVNDSLYRISFSVSAYTDVEISIVSVKDSSVIRHLAAGKLGTNPPPPLTASTLDQVLTWNGRDDFGRKVLNPDSLSVRVRAGMSTKLANIVGEELYAYNQGTMSVLPDKDGSVYILGKAGSSSTTCATFLRKYSASGQYQKTIFPPSPDLPAESLSTAGVNKLSFGWVPKTTQISADRAVNPRIMNSLLNNTDAQLLAFNGNGDFIVSSGLQKQVFGKNGSCTTTPQTLIAGPPQSGTTFTQPPFGPNYVTASANPKYLYISGWFYGSIDGYYFLSSADTTGFWADGQVMKLDVATGIATKWLKIDSVPVSAAERATKLMTGSGAGNFSAIHGVTIDDSGHVFVCDRLHKRVSVYDTNATLLGSIPCTSPDLVAVSKKTGAVYVLRRGSGVLSLAKFTGWRNNPTQMASVLITTSVVNTGRYQPATPSLALVEGSGQPTLYVGYQTIGIRSYADNGTTLDLVRDFSQNINGSLTFERIAVDRKNENIFWTRGARSYAVNFAITSWKNPITKKMQTAAKTPFFLDNLTVAPNGLLYGVPAGYEGYPSFTVPAIRFTNDTAPAPAIYANTGKQILSCGIGYEGGDIGMNHRGLAVGWQKQVAVFEEYAYLREFPDTGYTDTTFKGKPLITLTNPQTNYRVLMNCVKYDPAGNFYVGINKREASTLIPAGLENDNAFTGFGGTIMKFPAGGTGTITGTSYRSVAGVTGQSFTYPQPFGLMAGDNSSICNCRNPYFDLDPYGRLFIPNAAASQVAISDNAGNTVLTFGKYGNTDSRGRLGGPGETSSSVDIPIGWITSVAASEDYVYIADAINARIVRVQMEYELDNVPGLTVHDAAEESVSANESPNIIACPNPFNPSVALTLKGMNSGKVSIRVYNTTGKMVADLTSELNRGSVVWNAKNISAGMYMVVVQQGAKKLCKRIVYSK